MSESDIERCELCEPAPHPNCEVYTQMIVIDPATGDRTAIDVCLEHYETLERCLQTGGEQ